MGSKCFALVRQNKIYNENCLGTMAGMPPSFIDLTVTSPPYDNLRSYGGYSFDFESIAKELYRVTKIGGVVVWIVNDATVKGSETGSSFKQALYFKEVGFNLHDTMIWEKDVFPFPSHNRYRSIFDYMFIFSKGKPKVVNLIQDKPNKYAGHLLHGTSRDVNGNLYRKSNHNKGVVKQLGVRNNIWKVNTEKNNTTGHPAVFPLSLAINHILTWSNEGDLVYDPFIGSGTTALAAIETNRVYIGSEISIKYFEIANGQIQNRTSPIPACSL